MLVMSLKNEFLTFFILVKYLYITLNGSKNWSIKDKKKSVVNCLVKITKIFYKFILILNGKHAKHC